MEHRKTLLMLCGPSGCGKSTLESQLATLDNVKKIISVTTRTPIRSGEQDGVDYHFISPEKFAALQLQNELVQQTEFAGFSYGTTLSEYTTEHEFAILSLVPSSAKTFIPIIKNKIQNIETVLIYFDISHERLVQNMRARGDSEENISNRIMRDDLREQMHESGLVADLVITDDLLNSDTCGLVRKKFNI